MAYQNVAISIPVCSVACDQETDVNQRNPNCFLAMSCLLLSLYILVYRPLAGLRRFRTFLLNFSLKKRALKKKVSLEGIKQSRALIHGCWCLWRQNILIVHAKEDFSNKILKYYSK